MVRPGGALPSASEGPGGGDVHVAVDMLESVAGSDCTSYTDALNGCTKKSGVCGKVQPGRIGFNLEEYDNSLTASSICLLEK